MCCFGYVSNSEDEMEVENHTPVVPVMNNDTILDSSVDVSMKEPQKTERCSCWFLYDDCSHCCASMYLCCIFLCVCD
jgi:hypothetical protein